jgi:hypothetical protein
MDVIVAGGPAGLMTAALPDLPGYRGLDTPFPFTLTLPQRGTGHAPAVFLDARGVRVRHRAEVTAARQSADAARARQKAPFTLAGLSATLTGISSTGFGAHSPAWLARTCSTGRRDAASPAWNGLPRIGRPDSHATHSVTVIPAVN